MKMWVQLGVAVAILAVFCILNNELIGHFSILDANRGIVATVLISGGALGCAFSWFSRRKDSDTTPDAGTADASDEEVEDEKEARFFLFTPHYLGALAIAFGVAFYWLPGLIESARPVPVRAAPSPPRKRAEPLPSPPPEPAVTNEFPRVKIDGIFYRASRPAVVIDRRMFFVGDSIEGARIVAIDRGGVTLGMGAQTKRIGL